ncbi:MAG: methyltransferase domain-containing protein, partial [Actinomycetota bacterium]|nr:methyltransferase domain-containing protein [Actinomycetota bacterium]
MTLEDGDQDDGESADNEGVDVGNVRDSYASTNRIARGLVGGFLTKFESLVALTGARDVHEVGCGQGELSIRLAENGINVRGSDVSNLLIEEARHCASDAGVTVPFKVASIYDLEAAADSATLVVACEMLEHLEDPERGLEVLSKLANPYLLVSVPREPIWRVLNVARGRYLKHWGNTPGHLQHWSKRRFLAFVGSRFDVVEVDSPFPWTMVLCKT